MDVFLETERLILRQFTEADLDDLVELNADPAVLRFINGGRPIPRAEVERTVLPGLLAEYDRSEPFGRWAAVEKAGGAFIGWFSLRRWTEAGPGEAVLGYRLRRAAWSQGYATEGSRALIRKSFTALGARRVVAHTMAVNAASRRVMEKCGMTLVRTFFAEWPEAIEGSEHGDVEYAITREEWERQQAGGVVG